MTKYILLAVTIFLLGSCKGEIEFKRVESSSSIKAPNYQDMFLVANPPNNPTLRDSLLVAFANKAMPDFCTLDADVNSYSIFFYESTRCTRNFDERNKGEYTSLAMDDEGCPDDKFLIFFWYKRSETNPKSWYLYLPEIPADTIYCEQRVYEKVSFYLWDLSDWICQTCGSHLTQLAGPGHCLQLGLPCSICGGINLLLLKCTFKNSLRVILPKESRIV